MVAGLNGPIGQRVLITAVLIVLYHVVMVQHIDIETVVLLFMVDLIVQEKAGRITHVLYLLPVKVSILHVLNTHSFVSDV